MAQIAIRSGAVQHSTTHSSHPGFLRSPPPCRPPRAGSRRALQVIPARVTGPSTKPRYEELRARRGRTAAAIVLVVIGGVIPAGGVALGLINEFGILIAPPELRL
ncbi:hypothetical protein C5C21_09750 [Rathayibacter tritici]|nr:hypothetical protein C5C21_09750 [Rathayibacter tritici]